MCFWETETVRPRKPSVLDEVARTLYVAGTLWEVVPQLFRDLRTALSPELRRLSLPRPPLRPLRHLDRRRPRRQPVRHGGSHPADPRTAPRRRLAAAPGGLPRPGEPLEPLRPLPHDGNGRRRGRAEAPATVARDRSGRGPLPSSRVLSPVAAGHRPAAGSHDRRRRPGQGNPHTPYAEFGARRVPSALSQSRGTRSGRAVDRRHAAGKRAQALADGLVQEWLDRIAVLGFHTAELDIREDSGRLSGTVQELAAELGLCIDFGGLREDRKQAFLLAEPPREAVRRLMPERLSPASPRDARFVPSAGPHLGPSWEPVAGGLDREHDPSRQRRADDGLAQPPGRGLRERRARAAADHALAGDDRRSPPRRRHPPRHVRPAGLSGLSRCLGPEPGLHDRLFRQREGRRLHRGQLAALRRPAAIGPAGRRVQGEASRSSTAAAGPWGAAAVRRPRPCCRCRRLPSPAACG